MAHISADNNHMRPWMVCLFSVHQSIDLLHEEKRIHPSERSGNEGVYPADR